MMTHDSPASLAQHLLVDATNPYLTEDQLRRLVIAAKDARVYGLCVLPGRAGQAAIMVTRSLLRVRTLIGFPTGVHVASVKGLETRLALQDGAAEIAVAPNIGYFLGGKELALRNEVAYVAKALREVAPSRARELAVVFDLQGLPQAQLGAFAGIVLGAGGHGLHLLSPQPLPVDTIRAILKALANRSTTTVVTIQMPVADIAMVQELVSAGVDFVITPNAADLARS